MSSPPPPNPTTTTTTTTTGFLKSVAQQKPLKPSHPSIYQTFYNPQPATTPAFPPPTQRQQHSNSRSQHQQPPPAVGIIPNSSSYPPPPVSGYPYAINRLHGFSNSDNSGLALHQLVKPSLQQTLMGGGATVVSGSANQKAVGQSSVAVDNSLRDKNGDDAFVIIRDRKVQISEGTSLYAQCRSWLKNGVTSENQPQYPDGVKSLPKPLPASVVVEAKKEDDMEIDEMPENVDHLSAKELLQLHVNHAKQVRAKLRNQRLQRIERYKERLALLLPPVADQQPKNDPAP